MNDATLVYTANGHPTAVRLTRLRKERGWKYLHRNAEAWDGNLVADAKRVVVESLDYPTFDFRYKVNPDLPVPADAAFEEEYRKTGGEHFKVRGDVYTIRKTLAEAYEEIGIPVRVLRPRQRTETLVIDLDGDAEIKAVEDKYLTSNTPPEMSGKKALKSKRAKAAKQQL